MGIAAMADDFRTAMKLTSPVWVDTQRLTYKALKFTRGAKTILNPRSLFNALRALSKGHRQHKTQGDALLNGGVLIVRQSGECAYAWASQVAGDHPKTDDVLVMARKYSRFQ
jgi:hypothetical protein